MPGFLALAAERRQALMNRSSLSEKQKKRLAAGALAVFILFSAAVFWFVGRPMIRFARRPELFRAWVEQRGLWGKAAYVGMVFLQVLVAIRPMEADGLAPRCPTMAVSMYCIITEESCARMAGTASSIVNCSCSPKRISRPSRMSDSK